MARTEEVKTIAKETWQDWKDDDAGTWAASVAFYTIFSLAPLLVVAVAVAGFVFGEQAAQGELAAQMEQWVGSAGAEVVQTAIANASEPGSGQGILATIVGIVLLLLGACKVFSQLQQALNRVWDMRTDPEAGLLGAARKRLTGFVMVLGVGVLLMALIALSTVLSSIQAFVGDVPGGSTTWMIVNLLIQVGVITLLFALIFKYVPDVQIEWSDVWFGAAVTAVLFVIGQIALSYYLSRGSVGSAYGAAGSLVVLLAWIFYSAQILFMGAEFTQTYARHRGRRIEPSEEAIPESEAFGPGHGQPA